MNLNLDKIEIHIETLVKNAEEKLQKKNMNYIKIKEMNQEEKDTTKTKKRLINKEENYII